MLSHSRFALVTSALCFALVSLPAAANAEEKADKGHTRDALDARRIATDGLVERGSLKQLASRKIRVSGRAPVKAAKLASQVLAHHRALGQQLAKANADALYGGHTVKEELIRTKHATVFVSSISFTVEDPAALRASVPRLKHFRANVATSPRMLAQSLTPPQRDAFKAFKQELAAKPASHPLRKHMDKGDQALLDAIALGVGDQVLTTRVALPTDALNRPTASSLHVPLMIDRAFDFTSIFTALLRPGTPPIALQFLPPIAGAGSAREVVKFLTGFTISDAFEWEKECDFGVGLFQFGAHAWYGFGLRVPLEFTVDTSPTSFQAGRVSRMSYQTVVDPRVLDANESFYRDVGLSEAEAFDGKELVVTAGAYVSLFLEVLGGTIVNETLPPNLQFDLGRNFRPPFDGCSNCGLTWWVPANVTRTNLNVLGIITGRAQVGFELGGEGEAMIAYESIVNGAPVDSVKNQSSARTHELSWSRDSTRTFNTEFRANEYPTLEQWPFGWRLSNPRYDWTVSLRPGVKGTIDINFWPLNERVVLGPIFLQNLAINLGTLHLPTHAGTTRAVTRQPGTVTR